MSAWIHPSSCVEARTVAALLSGQVLFDTVGRASKPLSTPSRGLWGSVEWFRVASVVVLVIVFEGLVKFSWRVGLKSKRGHQRAITNRLFLNMQDAFDHDAYSKVVLEEEAELFPTAA